MMRKFQIMTHRHEYQMVRLDNVLAIAEHSICQPGRPFPQGESQLGSPGFAASIIQNLKDPV